MSFTDNENDHFPLGDFSPSSMERSVMERVLEDAANEFLLAAQPFTKEQPLMQDSRSPHIESFNGMNINNNRAAFHGTQFHSHEANGHSSHTTCMNLFTDNAQAITTGMQYSNKHQISKAEFVRWYLEQLKKEFECVAEHLHGSTISNGYERFMQNCRQDPQLLLLPERLAMLSSTIQLGQLISHTNSDDLAQGEEPDICSNRLNAAPTDENDEHTDDQLRELTQSDSTTPHTTRKNLSELLLQPLETIQVETLTELEVVHPPKPYWHARTINCLASKICPPLQSTTERQGITIKQSNLNTFNENDLFAHVRLLDYNNKTHSSKFIVPPETVVADISAETISINKKYGCNLSNRTILLPLTNIKSADHLNEITLPVTMYNSMPIKKNLKRKRGPVSNHQPDQIFIRFIREEIEKICKLRIVMCRLGNNRQLECVSGYVDTDFIRESKGTEELKAIDRSKITPIKPCGCGNEDISVLLNTNSEKAGFILTIDERQLEPHEFNGVTQNTITIHPPKNKDGKDGFHLIIQKMNVLKTIQENLSPWDVRNLVIDTLWDERILYNNRNGCCHRSPRKKKTK